MQSQGRRSSGPSTSAAAGRGTWTGDRGAVTVEAAFASVGLVALLAVLVSAISVVLVQVQCVDAAGAIARQAARGDASGVAEAERHLPQGGHVVVRRTATTVTVDVGARVAIVPGTHVALDLSAASTAVLEPGGGS